MSDIQIQDPPGFELLSKAEQVRYLQRLWDRIPDSPGEIPAPDSHLDLVEQRLREHHTNPTETRDAFEILDHLSRDSG